MSAKPSDELGGSEEKWFGDDYERNGLFGSSTPSGFGELRDEFEPISGDGGASDLDRQFNQFQDDVKRPAVAMETASTGKAVNLYTSDVNILITGSTTPSCRGRPEWRTV